MNDWQYIFFSLSRIEYVFCIDVVELVLENIFLKILWREYFKTF